MHQQDDTIQINDTKVQPEKILKEVFGYSKFRSLQKDIIHQVLQKRDAIAIMPTGGGKSLCYQIPALIFDGLTVVISPLISLMKDQVDQLTAYGVSASYLNSSLLPQDYEAALDKIRLNNIDLLYLAPETLLKDRVMRVLLNTNVECIAIDEAHCISEWGHDFRPEYRQISAVTKQFENAVTLALTATATPRVQNDIAKSLELTTANTFVASFNRENLYLNVVAKSNPLQQIINFAHLHKDESGVIYCFSRKQVDELYQDLKANGFNALPYHAGLSESERTKNQEAFIKDEADIIVATIAFGMGIDKPDVRYVVHYDMPKNIESYYQQIGRAGRDGLQAHCLFLFGYGDANKIRYFIGQKEGKEQQIAEDHLQQLIAFAEAHQCRRIKLLEYFGEQYSDQNCGMCDVCTGDIPQQTDITIPAQKFLSTIVRTEQRFGYNHIIHILRGSRRKQVLALNHDTLSTFGIGKDVSTQEWKQIYRELLKQQVIIRDMEYKSLKLTPKAKEILVGDQKLYGIIDEPQLNDRVKASKSEIESLNFNRDLFQLLRDKRSELARSEGVAPFIIFGDSTLIEMAYYYPQTIQTVLTMHGVGRAKAEKYGEAFLSVIVEFCQLHSLEERSRSTTNKKFTAKKALSKNSRPFEIGNLFKKGLSVPDIAAQYDIKEGTVISNLLKFVRAGEAISPTQLKSYSNLSEQTISDVELAFQKHGYDLLRPVFDALNEQVSYDDLRIIQLYNLAKNI
jgi:ATP-dependent DNA helicase RecQ